MTPQQILIDLFPGNQKRYIETTKNGQGFTTVYAKINGKDRPLTDEAYSQHVDPKSPIGIGVCPDRNGYCKFATIDVDNPSIDINKLNQRIQSLRLPLVLYKSKSKGCHLVMEFTEWVETKKVLKVMGFLQQVLDCWSLKTTKGQPPRLMKPEIYPKGDNRINLPYFYYNGSITRGSIGPNNQELTIEETWERANSLRQNDNSINKYYVLGTKAIAGQYDINFNVALWFKKTELQNWKELLKKFNQEHIDPPTDDKTIEHIIKSHEKEDYDWQKAFEQSSPQDLMYADEQEEFYKTVWYVKQDDRFWDNTTNTEYRSEAINITYGKIFKKTAVKQFTNNPNSIKVEAIVYRPDLYNPKSKLIEDNGQQYINKYRPSNLKSIKPTPDKIRPFFRLIRFLLPKKIEREWLLDFLCTNVKFPGLKIRHSILIYKKEFQIGSGSLFELIKKILGEHNCSIIGPKQALDKGKGFLVDKQLVLVDEIKSKADYEERSSLLNELKPMMTEDYHEIRPLFKDYRTVRTCTNYFLFTNYEDAISLPANEVRYTVFENLNPRMSDEFYEDFHKQLQEGELANVVKYYLEKRPIGKNFKPKGLSMKTKALQNMSEKGEHPIYLEVKTLLSEGNRPFERDVISISEVWAYLRRYKKVRGRENELAKALEKLGGSRVGDALHILSGRKPTVYAIRNVEFYMSKSIREIINDYWIPVDPIEYGIREAEITTLYKNLKEVEIYMRKIGKWEERTIYVKDEKTVGENEDSETNGGYNSVCWSCRAPIDSYSDEKCPECDYAYICSNCDNCACDKPNSKIKKKNKVPF